MLICQKSKFLCKFNDRLAFSFIHKISVLKVKTDPILKSSKGNQYLPLFPTWHDGYCLHLVLNLNCLLRKLRMALLLFNYRGEKNTRLN